MQRVFWPVTDLDELGSEGDLRRRLSLWAEDWFPAAGDVVHKIVSEPAPESDDLLVASADGEFWGAVCFGVHFRNELMRALPPGSHSAGDDERALLTGVAEALLGDLRREVFGIDAAPRITAGGGGVQQPDQLARISFETAPGEYVRLWLSADFFFADPDVDGPSIDDQFRRRCIAAEEADVTATLRIPTTMETLLGLAPGDVVPLSPLDDSPLEVRVSGSPVCSAYLGSSGDKKALLVVDRPAG